MSQILSLNGFVIFVCTLGLPLGLTKYVSEWHKDGRYDAINEILKKTIILLLALNTIFLIVTILFSKKISFLILDSSEYYSLIILISISFPFAILTSVFESYLRGLKKYNVYVFLSMLFAISSTVLPIGLLFLYSLEGVLYGIVISNAFNLFLSLIVLEKNKLLNIRKLFSEKIKESIAFRNIVRLGIASLLIGVLDQMSLLVMRSIIIKEMGIEANGIYQCVFAVSNNYLSIFFVTMGTYYLPTLSEYKDPKDINKEINTTLRFSIFMVIPLIIVFFVFRYYVVVLFYSENFINAQDFFFLNFLGDFLKTMTWVIGMWLITSVNIRIWIYFDLIYYSSFVFLFYIFLNYLGLGLNSITLAYFISASIKLILNFFYLRFKNKFKLEREVYKTLYLSTVVLLVIFIASQSNPIIGYLIFLPGMIALFYLTIKKEEFIAFKTLVIKKFTSL